MKRKTIILLGILTTFGASIGVVADVLSVWSMSQNTMETAFSVDLDSIRGFYEDKPRWTFVLGNYLAVYFIPLHILGFFLVYNALKPASTRFALAFLALSVYMTPIGVGLHGTLAFVGDIIQSGDTNLIEGIRDYWQPWAYSLVIVYAIISILILILIITGRSFYPRWTALISPIALVTVTFAVIMILPDNASGLKSFLSLTGLNLPLMVFFAITTWVLAKQKEIEISL
ncbi:MAG: DUF6796 family protein [Nitrosopumilus sp.]|jgi:glucan phosphoethanolaminetransferase (alkaline phosphatase superfamily)